MVFSRSNALPAATQPANWDGNSAVGSVGDGVSWTHANNWTTNGVVDVAPPTTPPGDDLTFGNGTVGTINLQGNEVANSLNFNAGFTLDAPGSTNTLTLATGTVNVGSSVSATVNAKLAGTSGLTLSGTGSLILNSANTYSGNAAINGGTLVVGGASAITPGLVNVNSGGSLLINASTGLEANLTNYGAVTVAPNQTLRLAPNDGELNQNAGQIEVGQRATLDTGGDFMSFNGGTIILDAGTSAQGQGQFKPTFIDTEENFTTPVTIESGAVGAGQSPGFVDLSETNQYAPLFSVGPGSGPVQMIVSATITDGRLTAAGGGVLELSGDNTYGEGTEVTNGTILIAAADSIPSSGSIQINTAGHVQLATGIGAPNTQGLFIERNSGLDIANNRLFINYGGGPDPIATIAAYIAVGYNNGAWNGLAGNGLDGLDGGIISSAAAANSGSYGIGYADYADPGNPAGLLPGQIEIMYTLLGDANLDGKVNGTDFNILAANFNTGGDSWDQGDFTYDGKVNGSDFNLLAQNFNQGATQSADLSALDSFAAANGLSAEVPEPASTALIILGVVGVIAKRRRL